MKDTLWSLSRRVVNGRLEACERPLLFCGNGYLAVQAGGPADKPTGTFINGFYESVPIKYGEKAFGFPSRQQVMIPLVDVLGWEVCQKHEGSWIALEFLYGTVCLDMESGKRILTVHALDREGKKAVLQDELMVSLDSPHCLYSRIQLNGDGEFQIKRRISSPQKEGEDNDDPRKSEGLAGEGGLIQGDAGILDAALIVEEKTINSGLSHACALGSPTGELRGREELIREYTIRDNQPAVFELRAAFVSSLDSETWVETAVAILKDNLTRDWAALEAAQKSYLAKFWKTGDVRFEKKPEYTRAMRFCSYGLLQSTGLSSRCSTPAKGLSSTGYNGHYFWDADVYVQAALNTLDPGRARTLLEYRIRTLDKALERACELSEQGALYPWRTINGRECSAYFPAGTAQFHINADIAWGLKSYLENSGDTSILEDGGGEMLFQTARFWAGFANHVPHKGWCLHCVTGPDEYTALVNNNFYTNLMAREHLIFAVQVAQAPGNSDMMLKIRRKMTLGDEEIAKWKLMAENFYIPRDEKTGLFMQDDSFMEKESWDWHTHKKRPLLLHYHPLKIYRHKVMKQPDVIMGLLLHKSLFSKEEFRKNHDYYDPLTSRDSSLSSAVQAAAAILAGKTDEAMEHFDHTLFLDLEDREGNTDNGIHLACMAGARIALIRGFAGYSSNGEEPQFSPCFPDDWGKLEFSLLHKDRLYHGNYNPETKKLLVS